MPQTRQWLNIVGTVDLTERSGTIDFVQPLTAAEFPVGDSQDVTIKVLDARGQLIADSPARVKLDTCINEGENLGGVVDTFLPLDRRTSLIQLFVGDDEVATYTVTASSPGGPRQRGVAEREADRPDSARFSVQISPDEGQSWQTVAIGLRDPDTYDVERSDFPIARGLRRRVVRTDGFESQVVQDDRI